MNQTNQTPTNYGAQNNDAMRRFIDNLHSYGINEYISLPEIAVLGETSSGKSSLLSALSGIPLPANANLTTRCPLRLRMEKNEVSKASIHINWHASSTDYADEQTYPSTSFAEADFDDNAIFLSRLTQEIKKAQDGIIEASGKEVSKDIIEVNFYGSNCSDLTLIDLPGTVRTVGKDESESIIEDIQLLIKDYLINDRCVMLTVVPANIDFHNSGIIQDAKKYDPSTFRTIPVITKPDLIDKGAEGDVHKLLLGEKIDGNLFECLFAFYIHIFVKS